MPISRLAECVAETQADIAASGLIAPIVGHVGDGNFHVSPLVDVNDPDEVERAEAFGSRLAKRAIAMEGTCTGEHGVGQKKIPYLEIEHGEADARPDAPGQARVRPDEPVQSGEDFQGVARLTAALVIDEDKIRLVARAAHAGLALASPAKAPDRWRESAHRLPA